VGRDQQEWEKERMNILLQAEGEKAFGNEKTEWSWSGREVHSTRGGSSTEVQKGLARKRLRVARDPQRGRVAFNTPRYGGA